MLLNLALCQMVTVDDEMQADISSTHIEFMRYSRDNARLALT